MQEVKRKEDSMWQMEETLNAVRDRQRQKHKATRACLESWVPLFNDCPVETEIWGNGQHKETEDNRRGRTRARLESPGMEGTLKPNGEVPEGSYEEEEPAAPGRGVGAAPKVPSRSESPGGWDGGGAPPSRPQQSISQTVSAGVENDGKVYKLATFSTQPDL